MIADKAANYYQDLVRELCQLPKETEWVEFKVNRAKHEEIGQYISALANSAALLNRPAAFMVWGISDEDHTVVGTKFDPDTATIGDEELQNWLIRSLEPQISIVFKRVLVNGHPTVVLEIPRPTHQPVRFKGEEYIRVGSYKKNLRDHPEKARELWRTVDTTPFEKQIAVRHANDADVIQVLDYPKYFELLRLPHPGSLPGILDALNRENMIRRNDAGGWDITNLGLVLFAKQMDTVSTLWRKAVRIIQYGGTDKTGAVREEVITSGYASGFRDLVRFIKGLLPTNETIPQAIRQETPMYPITAVRELVANALIHQDFGVTGTGPMVEVFTNRIEVTNPGNPLVDLQRLVDSPPKSRNESLAAFMRRIGICEERGSGWDQIVLETERFQLPPPLAEVVEGQTRVVLFGPRPLKRMERSERVRATYLHACVLHVQRDYLTNTSMRRRFGIDKRNSAHASRLIAEAIREGVIVPDDPNAGPRSKRYVPFWAKQNNVGFT